MADGNFLSSIGIDPLLITAGAAGGILRSFVTKQGVVESIISTIGGALTSNYVGEPAARVLSGIEVMGQSVHVAPGLGGFAVGFFAFMLLEYATAKARTKLGIGDAK